MATPKRILYTDTNFVETFIDTCTPKKRFYVYVIVMYLHVRMFMSRMYL